MDPRVKPEEDITKRRNFMRHYLAIFLLFTLIMVTSIKATTPYIVNAGDTVEIRVMGHNELTLKQEVTPDHTLSVPSIGRISVEGKTLQAIDDTLNAAYGKFFDKPNVVVILTPKKPETPPATMIYVVLYDVGKQTWEVKKTESVAEARAYLGNQPFEIQRTTAEGSATNITGTLATAIFPGDVVTVRIGKEPDFWQDNWYKVLTATSIVLSLYGAWH